MPTSSLSIRGRVTGQLTADLEIKPADITNAAPVGTLTKTNLAAGDNTITIPTGATSLVMKPPTGNTNALILKGAGADTGRRLHNTNPQAVSFDGSVTTFIINAGAITNNFEILFL